MSGFLIVIIVIIIIVLAHQLILRFKPDLLDKLTIADHIPTKVESIAKPNLLKSKQETMVDEKIALAKEQILSGTVQ